MESSSSAPGGDPGAGRNLATAAAPNPRTRWGRILFAAGLVAMLVGGLDPLEGSLLILPGGALAALGAFLGGAASRLVTFRILVFVLVSVGVGAMWGLTAIGGLGGATGRPMAWGLLILPGLVGWSLGIWGPGSPRWALWGGIGVGLWYLAIGGMILWRGPGLPTDVFVVSALLSLALLTLLGCAVRLRRPGRGSA